MLCQKTHFEQVPLALVKKLLEEQIGQESTLQNDPAISPASAKAMPLAAPDKSPGRARALSMVEVKKI